MKLKQYQEEALRVLRQFLEEARFAGPKNAYEAVVKEPEHAERLGRYAGEYYPIKGLPNVPYVCLRLPTGGGKTILGGHAIGVARDAWIEKDYPLVLWLVPTKTIREQTVDAFKRVEHPYRRAINDEFQGRVRVFDIAEFTQIRPQDIRDNLCLVVATIQSLRVQSTEGRRVYAHNEHMEPHFASLPFTGDGLEKLGDGQVKYSFANLMHIHRPLMIVDEAHNAVTGLTQEMQRRLNPSAIIEFTATPRSRSNVLFNVSAQKLKAEEMVKLPIMLSEHDTWQNAVNGAVAARASLESVANRDRDYIRPMVLFQAQPKNQEVTVEVLKRHLIETEHIPEEQIAVATGNQRELDDIDVFDPACPVRFVITVAALKEGWDCSFAYVFCSVARLQNATAVEQLLGRVLRMPYARRRKFPELNVAYAYVSEPSFGNAARTLVDKLVQMGFEQEEAEEQVVPEQLPLGGDGGLFGTPRDTGPKFTYVLPKKWKAFQVLEGYERVDIRKTNAGMVELTVRGGVDAELEQVLEASLPTEDREGFRKALTSFREKNISSLAPVQRGKQLVVPRLMAFTQGKLDWADTDLFMEHHDWSILDYPSQLTPEEFDVQESARSFTIDIDGNRVTYQFAAEQQEMTFEPRISEWTQENLTLWLDKQVRQPDIPQRELLRWLSDLVTYLVHGRELSIAALMRCKFLLARVIQTKIEGFRQRERKKAYQSTLFDSRSVDNVSISFEASDHFSFTDGMYLDQRRYRGAWKPTKHFLPVDQLPAFDGAPDGEELRCAQVLDSLSDVSYWLRNVARHPKSFWLPTSKYKFYPDFIAKLNDGRLFVVEYKGEPYADSPKTQEKRVIGRLWEQVSNGACLFLMVEKEVDGKDVRAQMLEKIHN